MTTLLLCIALVILGSVAADPVVIWNRKLAKSTSNLVDVVPIPTVEKPLVVFVKEMFDLGELSRAGDVYSSNSNGGKLSHLKKWMTTSNGYSVLYNVEQPINQIRESLESKVDESQVVRLTESDLDQPIKQQFAIIYVAIPRDIEEMDKIAEKFSHLLEGKDYTAVLFGRAPELVDHKIVKRAVAETGSSSGRSANGTYVNATNCMLFYAQTIAFLRANSSAAGKKLTFDNVTLENLSYNVECANGTSGNASLTLRGGPFTSLNGVLHLKTVEITMKFGIIGQGRSKSSAWNLIGAEMVYTLNGENHATSLCTQTPIETEGPFSFSCRQPSIFWSGNTTSGPSRKIYGCSPRGGSVGIKMRDFQVQPYYVTGTGKFLEASDCVGFFSIGIWMGLFAMVVMLLIFAFGIIMISDLKTQGRFDDPRGKPLQINVKE